jgi:geranylgeranyl pyrophosphate synthase
MNWNPAVLAFIDQHPFLRSWTDARTVLDAFEPHLSVALPTALPVLTCYAAGGQPERAIPLGAAFTLLHMAASILDDFQDRDTDAPWMSWSFDRVMNSTLSIIFLSQSCLARLEAGEVEKREILDGFAQTGILASAGQNEAVKPDQAVPSYWRHALAKTSLSFALAAWSGVRLATDDTQLQKAAKEYGLALGTLHQIADDFHDFMAAPSTGSVSALRASLPVVMALEQFDHPRHAQLKELLRRDGQLQDTAWAKTVCDLVSEMGGLTRTVAIGNVYEQKAVAALAAFDAERAASLLSHAHAILPTTPA